MRKMQAREKNTRKTLTSSCWGIYRRSGADVSVAFARVAGRQDSRIWIRRTRGLLPRDLASARRNTEWRELTDGTRRYLLSTVTMATESPTTAPRRSPPRASIGLLLLPTLTDLQFCLG